MRVRSCSGEPQICKLTASRLMFLVAAARAGLPVQSRRTAVKHVVCKEPQGQIWQVDGGCFVPCTLAGGTLRQ